MNDRRFVCKNEIRLDSIMAAAWLAERDGLISLGETYTQDDMAMIDAGLAGGGKELYEAFANALISDGA